MKKDKVASFKEAVFENLKVLDIVLRMFMTTIMVNNNNNNTKDHFLDLALNHHQNVERKVDVIK